jgi:folylpolyglutamate synthase/dihydropteroate synthase
MAGYSETLDRIYNLRGGIIDLRLDRVAAALKTFGHPERNFPSIHVAGTNGKEFFASPDTARVCIRRLIWCRLPSASR